MKEFDPERIYNLYFDTVYKVCFLYMKNHADAQDMTQDTFCQMLRKPFRYESDEKTKAWLIVCGIRDPFLYPEQIPVVYADNRCD